MSELSDIRHRIEYAWNDWVVTDDEATEAADIIMHSKDPNRLVNELNSDELERLKDNLPDQKKEEFIGSLAGKLSGENLARLTNTFSKGDNKFYYLLKGGLQGLHSLWNKALLLGEVHWEDFVETKGLKGDWLRLYRVWLFEESPKDLGKWSIKDGKETVTITDQDYIHDLRSKPDFAEAVSDFKKSYPDLRDVHVGDKLSDRFHQKDGKLGPHMFLYTGPGTTTGKYNAVEGFLGSYATDMTVKKVDPENHTVTVRVIVSNESHWESGTRVPDSFQGLIGSLPGMGDGKYLAPDRSRSDVGLGGDFNQRFEWEETISYAANENGK